MLPNDGPATDPVMMVAPDGTTVHIPREEYEKYRQEPDQPSPTQSDGVLRDMVDPATGLDQGGNPLQEGIWATTDNGWQPATKRDESYASVNNNDGTVMDDNVKTAFVDPILDTHIEMPWYMDDPVLNKRAALNKEAGPLAAPLMGVGGALLRKAAPSLLGHALGTGIGNVLNGGGAPPVEAQPGAEGNADAGYYSAVETPHSNPSLNDTEDGDTKQFDADSTSTNPDNPNRDTSGGSTQGEDKDDAIEQSDIFPEHSEGIKRLEMMLPLIMHYVNSNEEGINDPVLRSLHELLESEAPGYMDHADDHALEEFMQKIKEPDKIDAHKAAAGMMPLPQQNLQGAPLPGTGPQQNNPLNPTVPPQPQQHQIQQMQNQMGQAQVPGVDAQAPATTMPQPVDPAQQNQLSPEEQEQLRQMLQQGQQAHAKVAADHQGPATDEQKAAVAELLQENGRQAEIVTMLKQPWDFAQEMAQVAQRVNTPPNVDPNEEAQAPPMPAQEVAPPGDTMPVPNPADPSQQGAAPQMMSNFSSSGRKWNKVFAADNVAPRCPKCGSGTTGTDGEDGSFHCHACDNTWSTDNLQPVETHVKEALLGAPEHAIAGEPNGLNIPAADQDAQPTDDTGQQDSSFSWQDNSNQPLQAGQTYEMHSGQYSIPDIVKVMAVKPDSIVVQTVGEYSNSPDGSQQQPYTHEIKKEEAAIDDLQFTPKDDSASQGDPALQSEPQPASQVNTEPQAAPDTTARPSPVQSSASWLLDEDDDFASHVTANLNKTAGKHYTPIEQREFIEERGVARNSDKLDLTGTHYDRESSRILDEEFGMYSL